MIDGPTSALAHAARHAGHAGPGELLVHHRHLDAGQAPAAELLRPRHAQVAGLGQRSRPRLHGRRRRRGGGVVVDAGEIGRVGSPRATGEARRGTRWPWDRGRSRAARLLLAVRRSESGEMATVAERNTPVDGYRRRPRSRRRRDSTMSRTPSSSSTMTTGALSGCRRSRAYDTTRARSPRRNSRFCSETRRAGQRGISGSACRTRRTTG